MHLPLWPQKSSEQRNLGQGSSLCGKKSALARLCITDIIAIIIIVTIISTSLY